MTSDRMTEGELCDLARRAFDMGLTQGKSPGSPATSEWVCATLGIANAPLIYRASLQSVYRAGWDIGQMQRRFTAPQDRL